MKMRKSGIAVERTDGELRVWFARGNNTFDGHGYGSFGEGSKRKLIAKLRDLNGCFEKVDDDFDRWLTSPLTPQDTPEHHRLRDWSPAPVNLSLEERFFLADLLEPKQNPRNRPPSATTKSTHLLMAECLIYLVQYRGWGEKAARAEVAEALGVSGSLVEKAIPEAKKNKHWWQTVEERERQALLLEERAGIAPGLGKISRK
jgi:hypothetical protein